MVPNIVVDEPDDFVVDTVVAHALVAHAGVIEGVADAGVAGDVVNDANVAELVPDAILNIIR